MCAIYRMIARAAGRHASRLQLCRAGRPLCTADAASRRPHPLRPAAELPMRCRQLQSTSSSIDRATGAPSSDRRALSRSIGALISKRAIDYADCRPVDKRRTPPVQRSRLGTDPMAPARMGKSHRTCHALSPSALHYQPAACPSTSRLKHPSSPSRSHRVETERGADRTAAQQQTHPPPWPTTTRARRPRTSPTT